MNICPYIHKSFIHVLIYFVDCDFTQCNPPFLLQNNIYYIARILMGLGFLFIASRLHVFLSWMSSLTIYSSDISASPYFNHVFIHLPTGFLPSTPISIQFFILSSSYHLSLLFLITVVIGSTPTSFYTSLSGDHHTSI